LFESFDPLKLIMRDREINGGMRQKLAHFAEVISPSSKRTNVGGSDIYAPVDRGQCCSQTVTQAQNTARGFLELITKVKVEIVLEKLVIK